MLGGTDGDDIMISSIGDDTLWGDGGNDRLEGGDGNDKILGGAGDDIITDLGGDDVLKGNEGNDVIHGGNGFNLILGGSAATSSSPARTFTRPSAARATTSSSAPDEPAHVRQRRRRLDRDRHVRRCAGRQLHPREDDRHRPTTSSSPAADSTKSIGEGGDDIMVGPTARTSSAAASGFDWASYKFDRLGVTVDLLVNDLIEPRWRHRTPVSSTASPTWKACRDRPSATFCAAMTPTRRDRHPGALAACSPTSA